MAQRTLSRSTGQIDGVIQHYYSNGNNYYKTGYSTVETLVDFVQKGDGAPFSVTRYTGQVPLLNGVNVYGTRVETWINYPAYPINSTFFKPSNPPTTKSNGVYATDLIARTNPSRPVVDVPVFIAELRDFPHLFKVIGDNVFKTVAKANLSYWFGWKPMISDIMKLCSFSEAVNKRAKELKHLRDHGLSCTRDLDRVSSYTDPNPNFYFGSQPPWRVSHAQSTQTRVWGHVKWKPTTNMPSTDQGLINLARRAVLGLTIDPATAWELIPFSWMVDWCSTIGDWLMANRNIVPAEPYDCQIMRYQRTSNSFQTISLPSQYKPTVGEIVYETKTRTPASASIEAYLPGLTLKQLSILGSLWTLRNRGGFHF